MGDKVMQYLNPITLEAKMFAQSLEALGKTNNEIDQRLIDELENVMLAIDKFLEQKHKEVLVTAKTKLARCDDIQHIKRFFRCMNCRTDLGKSIENVANHVAKKCDGHAGNAVANTNGGAVGGRRDSKARNQNSESIVKMSKKTQALLNSSTVIKVVTDGLEIGKKLKQLPEYDVIKEELIDLAKPLFPNQMIKPYIFGSRLSGVGNRESDLDIFLDIGNAFCLFENRASQETLNKLFKMFNALNSRKKSWKGLIKIEKARVPIIKVTHADTGIECDIGFSNSMGVVNTGLIDKLFELQPIGSVLTIFLKKWLDRTRLRECISTYSIVLMIIFFLQCLKYLPAINVVQKDVDPRKSLLVGPWLCTFAPPNMKELSLKEKKISTKDFSSFLCTFFQFYINFDFQTEVVSPYLGKKVKRAELAQCMPERYTNYVQENPDFGLELDKPMVIQDPIQLNHNVTKGIAQSEFKIIKELMQRSVELLTENK